VTGQIKFVASALLAGISLFSVSVPARADTISDSFLVTNAGGIVANVNGVAVLQTFLESSEASSGSSNLFNTGYLGNPSMYGKPTELREPDGSVSDFFGVIDHSFDTAFVNLTGCKQDTQNADGSVTLGTCFEIEYSSDPTVTDFFSPTAGFPTVVDEATGVFTGNATAYLSPQYSGDVATFFSDSDPIATGVPEPGSLILFGTGLLGLAGALRKKLRSPLQQA